MQSSNIYYKSGQERRKVHFIGIGGIGVSALAQYYLAKGCKVSGSDLVSSEITEALKKKGAKIYIGPARVKPGFTRADLVVYSPAVKADNSELKALRKLGIKCQSYPEALGELTKEYFTIAVSGTHGKSTVTAMIGNLLVKARFDPTVIVGTKLKEFGDSNCRVGKSKYLVIEADEHFASFLNYWPKIIVLTNIEREHLDYYQNLRNILYTYKRYIGHLPKKGILVANADDKNISKLKTQIPKPQLKDYSLKQAEAKKLRKILKIPGEHNVSNALATLAVARILKIPDRVSFKALLRYQGAWRRFEVFTKKLDARRYTLVSDYGHHPTEVKVTLRAAREKFPHQPIWLIFQPHQYQRTYLLWKDFLKAFRGAPADKIIITSIYDVAGREEKKIKEKVSGKKLAEGIGRPNVIYLAKEDILDHCKNNLEGGEVVIVMGAGDIYKLVDQFSTPLEVLRRKI